MRPERKEPIIEIAELAEELCDPRSHTEPVYGWTKQRNKTLIRQHTTTQAGLIQQLRAAVRHPAVHDEQAVRGRETPSRPPLQLEALARIMDITLLANEWLSTTRTVHRGDVESNIRALVGAAPRLDSDAQHRLLHDLRRWRGWAAVMTGWALPPYQPHVTCPRSECAQLGTLRIILERKTGLCVACQTVWDDRDGSINLLATYIASETAKPHVKVAIRSTVQGHGGWTERRSL